MLEVENTPGRLINQFANENNEMESEGISANTFEQKHFGGGFLRYQWDTRDRQFLTTKGIRLEAQLESMKGLNNVSRDLTRFSGEFSVYQRLGKLPVVLSNRTGYAHNFQTADEYDFFQANYLDGQQNLRGYRRNRFGGDQMFFNNFEARIALFRFWSYIAPGQAGIIGFYDVGRVWVAGEDSNTWHSGYGPGIFIAPATLSFSLMYGISPEDNYPIARLGFFF
jgi:outer membrane protein assembly factor BamA